MGSGLDSAGFERDVCAYVSLFRFENRLWLYSEAEWTETELRR